MIVYFMRHSETEWNVLEKLNGLSDVELSNKGQLEAKILGQKFKNINFDAIYSSPLVRAVETATIVSGKNNSLVTKCEEIIERDFGELEGCERSAYTIEQLEEMSESHVKLYRRVAKFLKKLERNDFELCLVVTHRAILRHIFSYINRSSYEMINVDNLGYFVAEYMDEKWTIVENELVR